MGSDPGVEKPADGYNSSTEESCQDERPANWSSTDDRIDSLFDQASKSSKRATRKTDFEPIPRELGPYRVEKLLGEGGFGCVYLAYDAQLKRHVAIKVSGLGHTNLLADAQKAAGLDHDGIVTVYGVETAPDGSFYLVMEYLEGGSLADQITSGNRMSVKEVATFVAEVADAVHHAHGRGIIHRDLKPANILLDSLGRPHIADFGLAVSGSQFSDPPARVCGTAHYMSPEQVRNQCVHLDERTDVWSLGVILYELLTGQTPFAKMSREAIFDSILNAPIDQPKGIHGKVPGDLEAVCLKCLEKRPEHRYQSAAELASDLRLYLGRIPPQAQVAGRMEKVLRWAKRRPVAFGLTIVTCLLLITTVVGFVRDQTHLAHLAQAATLLKQEANERGRKLRKFDYIRTIQAAKRSWENNNVSAAQELLSSLVPPPGEEDFRNFEWHYLRRLCEGAIRTLRPGSGRIYGVAYSPGGNQLATCAEDGSVRIWESETGNLLGELKKDGQPVYAIAYSPDGKQLATCGKGKQIRLWKTSDYQCFAILEGHAKGVTCLAYSPDGKLLASGSEDATLRVWDVVSGRMVGNVSGHEKMVHCLSFSPDGTKLFSGSGDGVVLVSNPVSPCEPSTLCRGDGRVFALAPSPDGRVLAFAREKFIYFYDLEKNTQIALPLERRDTVRSLAFSADGQTLASAGDDHAITIWDARGRSVRSVYIGHTDRVYQIAFSPENGMLVSASKDGSVKIWDPSIPQQRDPLLVLQGQAVFDVAYSADGSKIASISYDGARTKAWLWNADSEEEIATQHWVNQDNHFFRMAFLPDDAGLIYCARKKSVVWWDRKQDILRTFANILAEQFDIAVAPDGKQFAVAGNETGRVVLVNMESGEQSASLPGQRCVEYSPDGRFIAYESTTMPFAVELWDLEAGHRMAVLTGHDGYVYDVDFSRDGRYLATACDDGSTRMWDIATAEEFQTLRAHTGVVKRVVFHPSGKRVVTASENSIDLWDVETGALLLSFPVQTGKQAMAIEFSPDGRTLAMATWDGQEGRVDLWHAYAEGCRVQKVVPPESTKNQPPSQNQAARTSD